MSVVLVVNTFINSTAMTPSPSIATNGSLTPGVCCTCDPCCTSYRYVFSFIPCEVYNTQTKMKSVWSVWPLIFYTKCKTRTINEHFVYTVCVRFNVSGVHLCIGIRTTRTGWSNAFLWSSGTGSTTGMFSWVSAMYSFLDESNPRASHSGR
jgi:hypothetical protein